MSFWKNLFGGGGEASSAPKAGASEEYKGFLIRATLMRAGSEYQLAGEIEKEIGGERKVHTFIRADKFGSASDAESVALAKGRQIVDEQGERLFTQSWPKPN